MIRNICGNSASPLQGEVAGSVSDPTLRIGLISDVPAAQDDERNRPNPTLRIGLISDVPAAQDDERNRPNPTLRIGLISDVPAAQDDERNRPDPTPRIGLMSGAPAAHLLRSMTKALVLIVVAALSCSCSTRVVYEQKQAAVTSPNPININTAGRDELERLPGVGRKTAEAIVDHRTRHGAFRRVEHLMLIRGVSETRFIEIRDLVRTE